LAQLLSDFRHIYPYPEIYGEAINIVDYHARVFIAVIMEVLILRHRLHKYPYMFNAYIIIGYKTGIGKKGSGYLVLPKEINVM
jgi:hypothetical protein